MNGSAADLTARLPLWLREQLAACPRAGTGLHQWLYHCARNLIAHYDEQEIYQLLWTRAKDSGRPWAALRREIPNQIKCARAHSWEPRQPHTFIPAGRQLDIETINQILALSALHRRQRRRHSTYASHYSATQKPHL